MEQTTSKINSGITMREGFSCGFVIRTTDQYTIEDNAEERGINLTDKRCERINADIAKIEKNVMRELEKRDGIKFRDEGHNGDNDLVGTCWLVLGQPWDYSEQMAGGIGDRLWLTPEQAEAYRLMLKMEGTDVAVDTLTSYDGELPGVYDGCSKITESLVDVYAHFVVGEEEYRDEEIFDEEEVNFDNEENKEECHCHNCGWEGDIDELLTPSAHEIACPECFLKNKVTIRNYKGKKS